MDFLTLCAERYSVRSYLPDPVPDRALAEILRAGQLAPTAKNNQSQKIFVLQSDQARAKQQALHACYGAPLVLLICGDEEIACNRPVTHHSMAEMDASIVATHMMLKAYDIGVGCCWVMHFDPFAMRKNFQIPEGIEPLALLVMGYPAEDSVPHNFHSTFRPIEEVVYYDSF